MMLGSGSIRNTELGPIVQYGSLSETFPYDDGIYMMKLNGTLIKKMLTFLFRDDAFLGTTEFYQYSKGFKIIYDKNNRTFISITLHDEDIDDNRLYTIGIQNFHYSNLEKNLGLTFDEVKQLFIPKVISTSCINILDEFLTEHLLLDGDIEGRIIIQ